MPLRGIMGVVVEQVWAVWTARTTKMKTKENDMNINEQTKGEVTNEQIETKKLKARKQRTSTKGARTMKNKTSKKAVKATKTKAPKKAKRMTEEQLSKKYSHYVKGSLHFVEDDERNVCKIACTTKGCKKQRPVNTSDLFQVLRCVEHTKQYRNEQRKKNSK